MVKRVATSIITVAVLMGNLVACGGSENQLSEEENKWTKDDTESFEIACRDIMVAAEEFKPYTYCGILEDFADQGFTQYATVYDNYDKECYKKRVLQNLEDYQQTFDKSSIPIDERTEHLLQFAYTIGKQCVNDQ